MTVTLMDISFLRQAARKKGTDAIPAENRPSPSERAVDRARPDSASMHTTATKAGSPSQARIGARRKGIVLQTARKATYCWVQSGSGRSSHLRVVCWSLDRC